MITRRLALAASVISSVVTAVAGSTPASAQAPAEHRKITVDAASVVGTIKAFTQFNGAPDTPPRQAPATAPANPADAARAAQAAQAAQSPLTRPPPATPAQAAVFYRQLGITSSRTHDTGGGDTMYNVAANPNVIFPDKTADPNDPKSYNFGPTDLVITSLMQNGIEPFFRVGDGHDGFVPDMDRYVEVVRHIVLHYNKGWAGGYHDNIKYWEFWNEPDFVIPGRAQFWAGTPQQYFEFYAKGAAAIKKADSTALVGGPAIASDASEYQGPFLKYLRDHKIGIDFYTYHYYSIGSCDPYDVVRMTDKIRSALVAYGFPRIPIMITEFGYDLYAPSSGVQRPVFLGAELSYMQDTTMARSYYHTAGVGPLFGANGLTSAGRVFQAEGSMQATPDRLKAIGGDTVGFHVLAGRATKASSDTDQEIRVLITNYEIPEENRGPYENGRGMPRAAPYKGDLVLNYPVAQVKLNVLPRRNPSYSRNRGYDISIANLPAWAANGYTVSRYRLDDSHDMSLIDTSRHNERNLSLSADLPPPSMELIVIRSEAAGPATPEGVWQARSDSQAAAKIATNAKNRPGRKG